jgi:hypothetical protein
MEIEMELKAVAGFAIVVTLLVAAVACMIVFGRPSKRRKWSTDVGQGGDGFNVGLQGGSGNDFTVHSGGHDGGGDGH